MTRGIAATRRVISSAVLAVVAALLVVSCGTAGGTGGKRAPTRAERRAIVTALDRNAGVKLPIHALDVSTTTSRWAAAWSDRPVVVNVLHRMRSGWTLVPHEAPRSGPFDSFCAFAPSSVVRDLFGIACPPPVALHARRANRPERTQLWATFRRDPLTREEAMHALRLANPCVSRLDSDWASATAVYGDTSLLVWFRRVGARWTVAWDQGRPGRKLPARGIILSLASCTGYNAAMYGA